MKTMTVRRAARRVTRTENPAAALTMRAAAEASAAVPRRDRAPVRMLAATLAAPDVAAFEAAAARIVDPLLALPAVVER